MIKYLPKYRIYTVQANPTGTPLTQVRLWSKSNFKPSCSHSRFYPGTAIFHSTVSLIIRDALSINVTQSTLSKATITWFRSKLSPTPTPTDVFPTWLDEVLESTGVEVGAWGGSPVCICVYVHTHRHACVQPCVHMCVSAYTYTCMCTILCAFACKCIHIYMYVYDPVCICV